MVSEEEVRHVLTNMEWLNKCHCAERSDKDYFVAAGQTITVETLDWARKCPARREEVIWAYSRGIKAGYFGGLSAGQRQSMSLDQALAFIATDLPTDARELALAAPS